MRHCCDQCGRLAYVLIIRQVATDRHCFPFIWRTVFGPTGATLSSMLHIAMIHMLDKRPPNPIQQDGNSSVGPLMVQGSWSDQAKVQFPLRPPYLLLLLPYHAISCMSIPSITACTRILHLSLYF